jgi:hypothetical protein
MERMGRREEEEEEEERRMAMATLHLSSLQSSPR